MWPRRLVLCLVLWETILSQPIIDETQNARQTRQLDFVECCPCPGSRRAGLRDMDDLIEASSMDAVSRTGEVDDCPCRGRDADSDGASSIFLPRVLRPIGSVMRPTNTDEDLKPLLHPEVGLASSVLETLREATDEEYEEAVARDAARTAAREAEDSFRDSVPETTKNVVTIIVNPKSAEEDVISDSSHIHESRCIHSLGDARHRFGQVRKREHLNIDKEIYDTHDNEDLVYENSKDMDNGASNIHESILNINTGLDRLKLRTNPTQSNQLLDKNLKNSDEVSDNSGIGLSVSKIPNFTLGPALNKLQLIDSKKHNQNSMKSRQIQRVESDIENLDSNPLSSITHEQFIDIPKSDSNVLFGLNSLLPKSGINLVNTPFSLKNLLNLKDVELIPPKLNTPNINIPGFKFIPTLHTNSDNETSADKSDDFPIHKSNDSINDKEPKAVNITSNIMITSKDNIAETEILDALPSPSENHQNIVVNDDNRETNTVAITEIATVDSSKSGLSSNLSQIEKLDTSKASEEEVNQIKNSTENHNEDQIAIEDGSSEIVIDMEENNLLDKAKDVNVNNLVRTDCSENHSNHHDSLKDTSNDIISQEDTEETLGKISSEASLLQSNEEESNPSKSDTGSDTGLESGHWKDNVGTAKDRILNKLEALKTNSKIFTNSRFNKPVPDVIKLSEKNKNHDEEVISTKNNNIDYQDDDDLNITTLIPLIGEKIDSEVTSEKSNIDEKDKQGENNNENINIDYQDDDDFVLATVAPLSGEIVDGNSQNLEQVNFENLEKVSNSESNLSDEKEKKICSSKMSKSETTTNSNTQSSESINIETENTSAINSEELEDSMELKSSATSQNVNVMTSEKLDLDENDDQEMINKENINIDYHDNTDFIITTATSLLDGMLDDTSEKSTQVNIEDLEKASNSLLHLSNKKQQKIGSSNFLECKTIANGITQSNEFTNKETEKLSNSEEHNAETVISATSANTSFGILQNTDVNDKDNQELHTDYQDDDNFVITTLTPIIDKTTDDINENPNQINIGNLEKSPNSVLILKNKDKIHNSELLDCKTSADSKIQSSESIENDTENILAVNNEEVTDNIKLESSATSQNNVLDDSFVNPKTLPVRVIDDKSGVVTETDIENFNHNKEKTCKANLNTQIVSVEKPPLSDLPLDNDMTAEASEPVISIFPHTKTKPIKNNVLEFPLQRNIITQPSTLFERNDLFRKPTPDIGNNILNLKSHLPTLDEIRSKISNAFVEKDSNVDVMPIKFDSDGGFSSRNSLITTRPKTMLPPIKPLENINLDIFRINPSAQSISSKSIPILNLNSYKTRSPIPTNLDLKPIKLQSSLGKDGSLLGATLTFGPEKIKSGNKSKQRQKSSSILKKESNVLGSSPVDLPSLDDWKIKIRANTENLLNSPIVLPENTLRSIQTVNTFSDNLRSHTENRIRNAQQMLASTSATNVIGEKLAKPQDFLEMVSTARDDVNDKLRDLNILGEKLAKPQDLLEMVSIARDDVNDKLQAIHSDFNDRLTSLHESIVDQSKLPSIQIPSVKAMNRNTNDKVQAKPTTRNELQNKPLALLSPTQQTRSSKLRVNKPTTTNKAKLSSPKEQQFNVRPFKISQAASSLTPKSIKVPKLTTTSMKPPFSKPLQRNANVKLKEKIISTKEPVLAQDKKSVLRNRFKPSTTTTSRSVTVRNKPLRTSKTVNKLETKPTQLPIFKNTLTRNRPHLLEQKSKSFVDTKGFASELNSMQIPVPVKATTQGRTSQITGTSIGNKSRQQLLKQSPALSTGHLTTKSFKIKQPKLAGNSPTNSEILQSARQNSESSKETKQKAALLYQRSDALTDELVEKSVKAALPTTTETNLPTDNEQTSKRILHPKFSLPKITDTSFLSRVREAILSRISGQDSSSSRASNTLKNTPITDDMSRSASKNNEVMIMEDDKSLKENVQYRCKLVCVKEPIE